MGMEAGRKLFAGIIGGEAVAAMEMIILDSLDSKKLTEQCIEYIKGNTYPAAIPNDLDQVIDIFYNPIKLAGITHRAEGLEITYRSLRQCGIFLVNECAKEYGIESKDQLSIVELNTFPDNDTVLEYHQEIEAPMTQEEADAILGDQDAAWGGFAHAAAPAPVHFGGHAAAAFGDFNPDDLARAIAESLGIYDDAPVAYPAAAAAAAVPALAAGGFGAGDVAVAIDLSRGAVEPGLINNYAMLQAALVFMNYDVAGMDLELMQALYRGHMDSLGLDPGMYE